MTNDEQAVKDMILYLELRYPGTVLVLRLIRAMGIALAFVVTVGGAILLFNNVSKEQIQASLCGGVMVDEVWERGPDGTPRRVHPQGYKILKVE